ncbi:ABC transporter substrate-binding protein [Magnetovibrio sp.]|uniref:ABC transporter substrate-binding protein n=1 Tax=Magnetovibrio sp. TaxID=2024836 RepID=UPI002F95630B
MVARPAKLSFIATIAVWFTIGILVVATPQSARSEEATEEAFVIGLNADMSSASAESGEAIRRGMVVAIDEINAAGGILGKPLRLKIRDHRGNPARGIDNIDAFGAEDDVIAVMGGLHTPVSMAELPNVQRHNLIYLVPWAAGTQIVDNGFTPNPVFRVSVRDEYAGRFLALEAQRRGFKSVGLLLENTGWGRSNETAMRTVAAEIDLDIADTQWFGWGVKGLKPQVEALRTSGAQAIILVANAREGAVAVNAVARMKSQQRLPVVSHWGITGGRFVETLGDDIEAVDLTFLQTYSFLRPTRPERADAFLARYYDLFPDTQRKAQEILSPVGTAHAYDLTHMLARAATQAGSVDPDKLRLALENLGRYEGLVKVYDPPFTNNHHDALILTDFTLARFLKSGAIVPVRR